MSRLYSNTSPSLKDSKHERKDSSLNQTDSLLENDNEKEHTSRRHRFLYSIPIFLAGLLGSVLLCFAKFGALFAMKHVFVKYTNGQISDTTYTFLYAILFIVSHCNLLMLTIIWRIVIASTRLPSHSNDELDDTQDDDGHRQRRKRSLKLSLSKPMQRNFCLFCWGGIFGAILLWILFAEEHSIEVFIMGSYFMIGELLCLIVIVGCCEAVICSRSKHGKANDKASGIAGAAIGGIV